MKQLLVLITLITLGSCWHKKIYRKETLDGGIEYETPEEAEKNESYSVALKYAQDHFHESCHLDATYQWNKVERVGMQVVAGLLYYLDVNFLQNGHSFNFEIKVWLEPMNSSTGISKIQIVGCSSQ